MRNDGGLSNNEIDEYVTRGYIDDTDAVILKKMSGDAQVAYLDALVDKKQADRDRGHPGL